MMRRGGMMGQYTDTDDQYGARRVWTPQTGIITMMSGAMMGGSSGTTQERMVNMSMVNMSQMLEGKTGDDLNRSFLEAMIPHHQAAVDMAKYLAASNKPELVKLGADIIAAQTKEIEQMKAWQKAWGYAK